VQGGERRGVCEEGATKVSSRGVAKFEMWLAFHVSLTRGRFDNTLIVRDIANVKGDPSMRL
jgi:hypothetical protein